MGFDQTRRRHTGRPGHRGLFDSRALVDGDLTLASESTIEHWRGIATDPTTDWEVLLRLSYARDPMTSLWLANNTGSTADILDIIAEVNDEGVRAAVAAHPNTIDYTLTVLLRDPREKVRATASRNPALNRRDQVLAATDPAESVQNALIDNPSLDAFGTHALRQSTFPSVQAKMAALDAEKALVPR